MECACNVYIGDGPEFITEKIVRAKKEYRCCECGSKIIKGNTYEYVRGKWEDSFSTYRTCVSCSKIRKDYMTSGWNYGRLADDLYDCYEVDLY